MLRAGLPRRAAAGARGAARAGRGGGGGARRRPPPHDQGPQDVGRGTRLSVAGETDRSPGWWGSVFLLVADATFFGSLLFGYAFLWTVAPGWPPPEWLEPLPVGLRPVPVLPLPPSSAMKILLEL